MPISVPVTKLIDFECDRKILLEILVRIKNILNTEMEYSKHLLAGNILHLLLQKTFLKNFNEIEYFYYRKNLSLVDSVITAYNLKFQEFQHLFLNILNNRNNAELENAIIESFPIVEKQINHLANLSISLIIENENGIFSSVISDEFKIRYEIAKGLIISGKVDLLSFDDKKNIRIIELKTGRPKKEDEIQLMIYGEIIKKIKPSINFKMELWYSKIGERKLIQGNKNGSILEKIREKYLKSQQIIQKEQLPDRTKNKWKCQWCNLCDYIPQLF